MNFALRSIGHTRPAIEIKSVKSSLLGNMDVRGMLGMSDEVRKGYNHVQVRMLVDSTEDAATLTLTPGRNLRLTWRRTQ